MISSSCSVRFRVLVFMSTKRLVLEFSSVNRLDGWWGGKVPGRKGKGPPIRGAFSRLEAIRAGSGDLGDLGGGGALLALHDVKLDPLTLGERLEARTNDFRVVDEAIALPILRRNETEALAVVEPLHLSCVTHSFCSLFLCCSAQTHEGPGVNQVLVRVSGPVP